MSKPKPPTDPKLRAVYESAKRRARLTAELERSRRLVELLEVMRRSKT